MTNPSMEGKLLFAQTALANASGNIEIKDALALFGYDEAKMQSGQALYTSATDNFNAQKKEYGEQFAATDALHQAKTLANATYMVHLKVARIALRNNRSAEEALQLSGNRKDSLSGWLKQARAFYTNALNSPDVLAAMATFGIDQTKLEAGRVLVNEVEAKLNAQLKEKGEAQDATKLRDAAFDDLQDWMSDFVAIAHLALASKPQYLEMLGIVEPS